MVPGPGQLMCQAISKQCWVPVSSSPVALTTMKTPLPIQIVWFGTSMSAMDTLWFMTTGTMSKSLPNLEEKHPV